jgi:hypothetical protein
MEKFRFFCCFIFILTSKNSKYPVQGRLQSCGAVVARRSYKIYVSKFYDTNLSDADAVGSNPTRTIFAFRIFFAFFPIKRPTKEDQQRRQ